MLTIQSRTVATQAAGAAKNASLDVRQALQADEKRRADEKAKTRQDSAKVTLSISAKLRANMLQMSQGMNSIAEARKSAARAHAAQLKQQIDVLKKIAIALGPLAAKTLLRQIKHLAQQMRQVAAELARSSSNTDNLGTTVSDGVDVAMSGGDPPLDAEANPASGEETENGERESAPRENIARATAAAQAETSEAESAQGENKDDEALAARAEQAAAAAEREVETREEGENGKTGETAGAGGNTGLSANAHAEARQKQQDALLVRELANELRQLLNLVKGMLPKKDKEDRENIKEIEEGFAAIDDLAQELEAAAQSVTVAETSAGGAVDAAVGDVALSISVFA
jgi:hypothetical protein